MSHRSKDDHAAPDAEPGLGLSIGVRLAVLALAVIMLGGAGLVLVNTLGTDSAPVEPAAESAPSAEAAVDPVSVSGLFPVSPSTIPAPMGAATINLPASESVADASTLAELGEELRQDVEDRIDGLRAQWAPVMKKLADVQQRLDKFEQKQQEIGVRQAAAPASAGEIAKLQATVETLASQMDAMSKQLASARRLARRKARASTPKTASPANLPFTAQAIDWWGDQASLVVRAGDDTRFLSTGQTLAGWRLAEMDRSAGRAVFERHGQRVNLDVPR